MRIKLVVTCLLIGISAWAGTNKIQMAAPEKLPHVSSFGEWKGYQIKASALKMQKLQGQAQLLRRKNTAKSLQTNSKDQLRRISQLIQNEKARLEIAKDLRVTDYVTAHTARAQNQTELMRVSKAIASKLSDHEMAQILTHVSQKRPLAPISRQNPQVNGK
jgi:cytochrome c553